MVAKRKTRYMTDAEKTALRALIFKQEMCAAEIARERGVAETTVRRYAKECGVTLPKGDHLKGFWSGRSTKHEHNWRSPLLESWAR